MIRIGRRAADVQISAAALGRLHSEFARRRCVRLTAFLTQDLLCDLQRLIAGAAFEQRTVPHIGCQQVIRDPRVYAAGVLSLNRQVLFRALEQITGEGPIGGFDGQVYRLMPGTGEQLAWHDDRQEPGRVLGISVNLGDAPYEGGLFQIRDQRGGQVLGEMANGRPGDAVLFDVGPGYAHRVTPVQVGAARIALAGWFLDRPNLPFTAVASQGDRPEAGQ